VVERVTTEEAAQRLGISVATVRRRIAAGALRAEQEQRPQGTRWLVLLDSGEPSVERLTQGHKPKTGTHHEASDRELERALDEVTYLRRKLDELTTLLAREQQAHLETRLQLTVRAESSATAQVPLEPSPLMSAPSGAERRSPWREWWDRLWRRDQGAQHPAAP
jgi:excisionase family DNA binding protein